MSLTPERKRQLEAQLKLLMAEVDTPKPTPSNSTKTKHENSKEFERRLGYRAPTADLVAAIEAAASVVWIPCGYVLFARASTCRHCGATERCLDVPQLFLQSRKERRDDSNPYLYTPVRSIEYRKLPRRQVLRVATTPFCLNCFEGATPCQEPSSSEKVDTALPTEPKASLEARIALSASTLSAMSSGQDSAPLQLSGTFQSFPHTLNGASAGSPSETDFGSVCGEREFAKSVDAEG